jgi:peptide/nickel transport system substrate-binding protein
MKNALGFLLLLLLCACTDSRKNANDTAIFRYNEHANVTSLDPAFAKDQRNIWVCNLLYNGLVKLDIDLEVVSDIATRWQVSSSALEYTFYLKKDVQFAHSPDLSAAARQAIPVRTLNAHDIKYSLERLQSKELASPGSWIMDKVAHITIVDDLTLTIMLREPFPAFLGLLSMKYASVVQPEAVAYFKNDFRSNPVGTGPFYLKRWNENQKMVLRKNNSYFESDEQGTKLPYLEAVAITFKNDKQSEFLEFAQGNLDFINAIDPSYKDELLTTNGDLKPAYQRTVTMVKAPFLNTEYLGIYLDSKQPEYRNKNLRKAINMGFDRVKMIKYLRNNIGVPATSGFIPAGLPAGGVVKGYEYDMNAARKLVAIYKKESGDTNPEINIVTSANYLDLCEFMQKELEKIGITATVEVMPPSTLRQERNKGNLNMFRASWIADYPDAENYLSLFYSKNKAPVGSNYTHFSNATFDTYYERALTLTSAQDRKALYVKMDSIIINDAPVVPLYYDESVRFINKKVKGMETNAVNMLDLTRVQKN